MSERTIIATLQKKSLDKKRAEESLTELVRLVETAGGSVVARFVQKSDQYDPAYLIGPGKAAEIAAACREHGVRTVVFNNDLTPAQTRNLEELLECKIIDRTRLILDIFAMRARTREGILQVEHAHLSYLLPRLSGKGRSLSQQVGGIGTRRGPGEKKLEIDQRRIRDRITSLGRAIDKVRLHRELQREKRVKVPVPVVALVGYTNVGKSTLLNALVRRTAASGTARETYVDDKLFATLDPTTRRVKMPSGAAALFVDTVGFIDNLPHHLVAAFRATMEEALTADVIIHLTDASAPNRRQQAATVYTVLEQLGVSVRGGTGTRRNIIDAFTKSDLLEPAALTTLEASGARVISCTTGHGISRLLSCIDDVLAMSLKRARLLVPYTRGDILARISRTGRIISQTNRKHYIAVQAYLDEQNLGRIQKSLAETAT